MQARHHEYVNVCEWGRAVEAGLKTRERQCFLHSERAREVDARQANLQIEVSRWRLEPWLEAETAIHNCLFTVWRQPREASMTRRSEV